MVRDAGTMSIKKWRRRAVANRFPEFACFSAPARHSGVSWPPGRSRNPVLAPTTHAAMSMHLSRRRTLATVLAVAVVVAAAMARHRDDPPSHTFRVTLGL